MPVNSAEINFFEKLAREQAQNPAPSLASLTVEEFRKNATVFSEYTGEPANIPFVDSHVPARDGYSIPIRIYNSHLTQIKPTLIFYPGCGYVLDLFISNAIACSRIALHAGVKVIVINFRLAPEFSLPTSIYDAYDATYHIATNAALFDIDPDKVFIGGISSGAHCAAVIAHLAAENKQFKIHRQILLNGIYDLLQTHHDYDDYAKEDKLCTAEAVDFLLKHYGIPAKEFSNPLFSPYYAKDVTHLPATSILVGEYDRLRSSSEAYYKKLKAAGVNVEKIILSGQTHNTFIMRKVLSDGEDPAEVIANIIKLNSEDKTG